MDLLEPHGIQKVLVECWLVEIISRWKKIFLVLNINKTVRYNNLSIRKIKWWQQILEKLHSVIFMFEFDRIARTWFFTDFRVWGAIVINATAIDSWSNDYYEKIGGLNWWNSLIIIIQLLPLFIHSLFIFLWIHTQARFMKQS